MRREDQDADRYIQVIPFNLGKDTEEVPQIAMRSGSRSWGRLGFADCVEQRRRDESHFMHKTRTVGGNRLDGDTVKSQHE